MTDKHENHPTGEATTKRWLFWTLLTIGVLSFVLFFVVPNFVDVPLRVSEKTTIITEPFFPNSQRLDYYAALQERFAPPDLHENGFRMIAQAVGGEPMERASGRMWEMICQQLDLNPNDPPTMPGYSNAWAILEQGVPTLQGYKQLDECSKDLWTQEQYPYMDEYLDEISPVLDLLAEAVCKEYYFMPQITGVDRPYTLICCHVSNRDFGQGLLVRANRSIRKGEFEAAWNDIIAVMRLGCHLQNDTNWWGWRFSSLVIFPSASIAVQRLLEHFDLSEKQLRQCIEDLKQLPKKTIAMEDMAMDVHYMMLGTVDFYSNAPRSERTELNNHIPDWGKQYLGVNWNLTAKIVNDYYDRQLQIYHRNLPPTDLQTELDKLKDDFKTKYATGEIMRLISRDARSKYVAHEFLGYPFFVEMERLAKTAQARRHLMLFAFELEIEKRNGGKYPATLDFLNGRYTPEELTDPFSGGPFEYQPNADGYGYRLSTSLEGGQGIAIRPDDEP